MTSSVRSVDMAARHVQRVGLVAQGGTPVGPVEEVSTSWERSAHKYGVNADSSEAPRILMSDELKGLREQLDELILSAQEEIDRLYKVVREAGYTLLFCNSTGVAVEHRGDEGDASRFKYWGTWLGGVWSEELEGTNGIGTCIAEERPVTVHRGQHYRSRHIDLSCSGAPIFNIDGRLIAVLDVSAIDPERSERAHALTGALTVAAARAIEERFFREQFRREWIVAVAPPNDGATGMLLAADGNQRVVGANRTARTSLLLDDRALRAGVSLWSFFERDRALFRRKDTTDTPAVLVIAGSDETRPALVTPPETDVRRLAECYEYRPTHTPALGFACQYEAARAAAADTRRPASRRHASSTRIRRNASLREHRSRNARWYCGAVVVPLRPRIQGVGGCDAASLSRTETRRTGAGDVGAHRAVTYRRSRSPLVSRTKVTLRVISGRCLE